MIFRSASFISIVSLILLFHINAVYTKSFYWPKYLANWYYSSLPSSNVEIETCDGAYALDLRRVSIKPAFVNPGDHLTIEAAGTLYRPVLPGSTANVQVKLGVVQLLRKRFDICEELEKHKEDVELQCPMKKGYLTVTQGVTLPKEIPRGKYKVLVHAFTDDNTPLTCLTITVNFGFRRHHFNVVNNDNSMNPSI